MEGTQKILDGKVNLYRRGRSPFWQCSTYMDGKNHRTSTKESSFALARDFAEHWYFGLRHRQSNGEDLSGNTFAKAADRFMREYDVMTGGTRRPEPRNDQERRGLRTLIAEASMTFLRCSTRIPFASLRRFISSWLNC